MPVSTTNVTGPIVFADGSKPTNGKVIFELNTWDKQAAEGLVLAGPFEAELDDNGNFDIELFSSSEGDVGTVYTIKVVYISSYREKKEEIIGSVALTGRGPFKISELNIVPAYVAEPTAIDALALAEAYALSAETSKDLALAAQVASLPWLAYDQSRPILLVVSGQSQIPGVSVPEGGARLKEDGVFVWEQDFASEDIKGWKEAGPDDADWPLQAPNQNGGIGYTMARLLRRMTGRKVYVVIAGAGGQPIAEWLPGGGNVPGATGTQRVSLWASFRDAIASPEMVAAGIEHCDMFIWGQGEADNDDNPNSGAAEFLTRTETFKNNVRNPEPAFNNVQIATETTPFIAIELMPGGTEPGTSIPTDDRNPEIRSLNYRDDDWVVSVDVSNLPGADEVHFTAESLEVIAFRALMASTQLPRRPISPHNVPVESNINVTFYVVELGDFVLSLVDPNVVVNAESSVVVTLPIEAEHEHYPVSITHSENGSSATAPNIKVPEATKTTTGFTLVNSSVGTAMNGIVCVSVGAYKKKV